MPEEAPNPDGSSPQKRRFKAAPPMVIDPGKRYTATMETSKGTMTIALDPTRGARGPSREQKDDRDQRHRKRQRGTDRKLRGR